MIRIALTSGQMKQLRKHFKVVNECARMRERGTLVAQVHQGDWEMPSGYVRVHFIPASKIEPVLKAVSEAWIPNGYAGIPALQHSGGQA